MIRNARMEDVKKIYSMLKQFAEKGALLGRSLSSLYDHLRDFKVFIDDETAALSGVCALHICWENLAEIRSLVVADSCQGRGIGTGLVEACISEAAGLGIDRIFTLTYQPAFFRRIGFKNIDKGQLPHKVWSDCLNCSKFPDCNEEAMIWHK